MNADPDIARVAALIGDPARSAILQSLLGGVALPATELALRAGVSAQTASAHLQKLTESGLLAVERSGRHRYFRLGSPEVAHCLEALGALAVPPRGDRTAEDEPTRALRLARSCYDHLAGRVGVAVTEALIGREYLRPAEGGLELTAAGAAWFADLGVEVEAAGRGRRAFARPCLDWSERRPHLAGALGAALLSRLLALDWLARRPDGRALRLTVAGRQGLRRELALDL
jgi:DNA-binding transcriptional ArsR family regulator